MQKSGIQLLTMAALLIAAVPAGAHFGMLIPSDSMVTQEDTRTVTLTLSFSHPFEMKGMEMARPKSFAVVTEGKRQDLRGTLKEAQVMGHRAWKTTYTLKRPGVHLFYMEPEPYWEPAEDAFILHYTKTAVAAFGDDEGWDAEIGLKTEIVPLCKPFGLYAGNVFQGIVKLEGKPVPHSEVEVEYYNQAKRYTAPARFHDHPDHQGGCQRRVHLFGSGFRLVGICRIEPRRLHAFTRGKRQSRRTGSGDMGVLPRDEIKKAKEKMRSFRPKSRRLFAVILFLVLFPATLLGYDLNEKTSLNALLAGLYQYQWTHSEDRDLGRGALSFQIEMSVRPTLKDEIFAKLGYAAGSGLNKDTEFNLAPWAAVLEDDIRDINGRSRDHLLAAWYKHNFEFVQDNALGLTGGAPAARSKSMEFSAGCASLLNCEIKTGPQASLSDPSNRLYLYAYHGMS